MLVKQIMTQDVELVEPESTLKDAAQTMDDRDIGVLPVCDNDRLVGIITDRDIIVRAISAGMDPNKARVADSMTSPILYCFEDQECDEVHQMMIEKKVGRLPVLSRAHRLVGIVSTVDFVERESEGGRERPKAA